MAMQRNPKVGDIVESRLWAESEPVALRFLKVTNIIDHKEGNVVQLKPFLVDYGLTYIQEEYILFFDHYYVILEDATEKSIKVLYGNRSSK